VTRPVTVEANKTVTENFELDPLAPAEFAVTIDDVDTRVDAGEPVVVNATVENIGDEGDANDRSPRPAPSSTRRRSPSGGESRQISLAWQTLPTDVGEVELAAASETDTATTTVRVLDAETDAVAYLDRDGDGSADETFTAAEMAFLNDLNGRFVVFDDARVAGSVAVDADRIAVEEDVTLRDDRDRTGRRRRRVTRRRVDARHVKRMVIRLVDGRRDGPVRRSNRRAGVSVTTAARALFGASAGDIDISAEGDVDVIQGAFDATGQALFGSGDGTIRIASDGGTVTATGAAFDPDPTIESAGE